LLYIAASVEQYCDITQVNALPENEGILELPFLSHFAYAGETPSAPDVSAFSRSTIHVRDFGVRGDGRTDNTLALFRLRSHLLAKPETDHTLIFPTGRYLYSNGFWLRGVRAFRLIGNGSVLKNIRQNRYDARHRTLVLNPGMFTNLDKLPQEADDHYLSQPGDLIETVGAGSRGIELREMPPRGRYIPGAPLLLHGFNMQQGGYPPNPKHFEWCLCQ
jgi:hypothetical protein